MWSTLFRFRNYITEKNNLFLLSAFLIIVLIKIFLSLRFPTPFVFGDEWLYASYAKDILSNPLCLLVPDKYQVYPPGYPLILTPAFIFYPNMELVYRSILLINALLSTSVLFIAYFILKDYIKRDLAILGGVLIALLPANTLYSFMILSENTYIPLYLLSGFLILKSFEKDNKFLHILTGFVLFYLILIRAFGIAAFLSFFGVALYKILTERNGDRIGFLRQKAFLIITPAILLGLWLGSKNVYNSSMYKYNTNSYLQNLLSSFDNIKNFILFLKLIAHEIDYLILASYFIFFIFFVFAILHWRKLKSSIKMYMLYSSIYGLLSILITVSHMLPFAGNPSHPQHMYYFIWGRYIDPVLPTIFIIGLIALDKRLCNNIIDLNYERKKLFKKLLVISAFVFLFFVTTYPYYAEYKVPNIMSIYYMRAIVMQSHYLIDPGKAVFQDIAVFPPVLYILIAIIATILLLFLIFLRKTSFLIVFLIIILIVFSIIISIPSYNWLQIVSNKRENVNEIGKWLINNAAEGELIFMDKECFINPYTEDHCLIKFWGMPMNFIYGSLSTNFSADIKYIVSNKPLTYEIVAVSSDGMKLYRSNVATNIQVLPHTGFYRFEYKSGEIYNTWMSNNATLFIYTPQENSSILSFKATSFYKSRTLQVYLNKGLIHRQIVTRSPMEIRIPIELKKGKNVIRFYTPDGCQRPCDVINSIDTRCLSIHFQQILLVEGNT